MKKLLLVVLMLFSINLLAQDRIISIGPDITEIIYQLGDGDKLVGRDMRSMYPTEAQQLADVGYMRRLNAEGLLSLRPSLIIASELAAPSIVFEQMQDLGVPVIFISGEPSVQGMVTRITQISHALSRDKQGQHLVKQMEQTLAKIPSDKLDINVLFIRSFSGNSLLVGGKGTLIDGIIEIAGLNNAFSHGNQYKIISGEGLIMTKPDMIVTTTSAMQYFDNQDDFWKLDQLINTPAGKNRRLLIMDDMALFSFGLQTPEAILSLRRAAEEVN